jgi:hypothetical protein
VIHSISLKINRRKEKNIGSISNAFHSSVQSVQSSSVNGLAYIETPTIVAGGGGEVSISASASASASDTGSNHHHNQFDYKQSFYQHQHHHPTYDKDDRYSNEYYTNDNDNVGHDNDNDEHNAENDRDNENVDEVNEGAEEETQSIFYTYGSCNCIIWRFQAILNHVETTTWLTSQC